MASNPGLHRSSSMDNLLSFQQLSEGSQSSISLRDENELNMKIQQELIRIADYLNGPEMEKFLQEQQFILELLSANQRRIGNKFNESEMRIIEQVLRKMSDRLKELHSEIERRCLIGGAFGVFGVGLGLAAVGGLLFRKAENTLKLILGVPAILASSVLTYIGFTNVCDSNSEMLAKEREVMEIIDRLSKKFKDFIEPQKNTLEEITNVGGDK